MYHPVAITAGIATVVYFLTGISILEQIDSNGSTKGVSGFPFICGLVSCGLWIRNGYLENDDVMLVIAILGFMFYFSYIFIYASFNGGKTIITQLIMISVFVIISYSYLHICYNYNDVTTLEKTGTSIATIIFIASPLIRIGHVINFENTKILQTPMIIMSLIVSILWFSYGIVIDNNHMRDSNFFGMLIAVITLIIVCCQTPTEPESYQRLKQSA